MFLKICSELRYVVYKCLVECRAGMKNGIIADEQISESSFWIRPDEFQYEGKLGRLDHRWCWIANRDKRKLFLHLF